MNKETGGPAFPVTPTDRSGQIADTEIGMTLRDYFAAKAMQALIAVDGPGYHANRAKDAYDTADAMIEARK